MKSEQEYQEEINKEHEDFDNWFKDYCPDADRITYLLCRAAWMERALRRSGE